MSSTRDTLSGLDPDARWSRVASELRSYRDAQREYWGGLDDATIARYLTGEGTAERARVEQAVQDSPELRERIEKIRAVLEVLEPTSVSIPADRIEQFPDSTSRLHADAWSSRLFGNFELLEIIALGGMGRIYRAREISLNRIVALKMCMGRDPASLQRFRHEAEITARVDHPHIIPIYCIGEHEGVPFVSWKLADGGNLAQCLPHFTANPRSAAKLAVKVAGAVHHMHNCGIQHGDLKPASILLDAEGNPYVTDFDLAAGVVGGAETFVGDNLVGTPSYMAPERAAGPVLATVATDVYGLGAVLYAMLSGRAPAVAGTVLEIMEGVRGEVPEPPSRHNPRVPRDLERICLRCLEKEPGRRYGSAAELADDLERWLAGEPIKARPSSPPARALHWYRRNAVLSALAASAALLLVMGMVGLTLRSSAPRPEARPPFKDHGRLATAADPSAILASMYQSVTERVPADPSERNQMRRELLRIEEYYLSLAERQPTTLASQQEVKKGLQDIAEIRHKLDATGDVRK